MEENEVNHHQPQHTSSIIIVTTIVVVIKGVMAMDMQLAEWRGGGIARALFIGGRIHFNRGWGRYWSPSTQSHLHSKPSVCQVLRREGGSCLCSGGFKNLRNQLTRL